MKSIKNLNRIKNRRKSRVRAKIFGIAQKPRLAVFRSNKFIYAQLINDEKGQTFVSASSRELKLSKSPKKINKTEEARLTGELIAKKAGELGIKEAVFDRRSYHYHGRVSALVEGARKNGLKI